MPDVPTLYGSLQSQERKEKPVGKVKKEGLSRYEAISRLLLRSEPGPSQHLILANERDLSTCTYFRDFRWRLVT